MIALDLPPLVAGFGRRLHDAGLPVTPERAARFAEALKLTNPVARTRLYWIARATLLSDVSQRPVFDRVFAEVFGTRAPEVQAPEGEAREASDDARPGTPREGESVSLTV